MVNIRKKMELSQDSLHFDRTTPLSPGVGGTVIRLGGLYHLESGAHNFWAKGGAFPSKPAGLINLVRIQFNATSSCTTLLVLIFQKILLQQVHYADAASAVVLALQNPSKVSVLKNYKKYFDCSHQKFN